MQIRSQGAVECVARFESKAFRTRMVSRRHISSNEEEEEEDDDDESFFGVFIGEDITTCLGLFLLLFLHFILLFEVDILRSDDDVLGEASKE